MARKAPPDGGLVIDRPQCTVAFSTVPNGIIQAWQRREGFLPVLIPRDNKANPGGRRLRIRDHSSNAAALKPRGAASFSTTVIVGLRRARSMSLT